jgi:TolA-binding protein
MSSLIRSLLRLFAIGSMGLILYACSSVQETADSTTESNEFFDPSTTVVKRPSERSEQEKLAVKPQEEAKELSRNEKLVDVAFEQSQRLMKLLHQLQSADPQFVSGITAVRRLQQTLEEDHGGQAVTTDRQIVELLKEQNSRLIDVLEQLKTVVIQQEVALRQSSGSPAREQKKNQVRTLAAIDAKIAYGRAIRLYEEHRYGDAIVAFQRLLLNTENDDLTDNCRFWIGVSNFNLQKYEEAIPQFKDLLAHQWFEKREDAYIMLGQCYEQAGEPSLAKAIYEKLVQLNPVCDLAYVAHLKISML